MKVSTVIVYAVISILVTSTLQQEISQTANNSVISKQDNGEYDIPALTHDAGLGRSKRRVPIWFAMRNEKTDNVTECSSSADDFPNLFTPQVRKYGAILIHVLVATYCFVLIAIICDSYFIPCVEKICEALNLSEDVAAATFMSIATSAPELFVNIIGTFLTKSDIGIGTIVGSSMFNTLGVASVGGLAAVAPIQLAWWPLCRDITLYGFAVSFLVVITWDGRVMWWEAFWLFCGYIVYFVVMFQNNRISQYVYSLVNKYQEYKARKEGRVIVKPVMKVSVLSGNVLDEPRVKYTEADYEVDKNIPEEEPEPINIYKMPKGKWSKAFFIYSWPLKFMLYWTVPDVRKFPKLYPVTFVMCIVWIGCNSYLVSWMLSIIGVTFEIPDAVLGLTFLAAGGCLPETFSIAIMSRKGEGRMGVSNALGANTMNILLSLGMPWFIKTLLLGADENAFIDIESGSLEYTIMALIIVALTLFITLAFNKFRLSKVTGTITLTCYFAFLALAIVADMVIFPPDCV